MEVFFIQNNGIQESIGVASLAGMIKANGHQADLLLASHTPDLRAAIDDFDPAIVAFSALTGVHNAVLDLVKMVKTNFPKITTVVGGPHPTYSPKVIEKPGVDIICRGEGELAFLELCDELEAGNDIRLIQNLWVKDRDGDIHRNELRPPADLNELPFPDREIYYKYDFIRDLPMKRFIASIGCPYPCTFCHEPVISEMYKGKGKYYRRKSPRRVVDEITYMRERYALAHVHFSDDLFFLRNNYEWLAEFSEMYSAEIDLPYNCNIRYDSVVERSANLLKVSKCFGVAVGLESGNQFLREVVIKKRVKNDHMVEGAKLMHERGIKMLTTNMIGLPGETLDQAFDTVELNMRLKSNYTRANMFLLFPDLPLVDYAKREGFIDPKFDIENHVAEALEINLKTPYAKEFRNICALFWLLVKFDPRWIPLFKKIVAWPDNIIFRIIGAANMVQELRFYRLPFWAAVKFFRNTVLVSNNMMTMRNSPALFKAKKNSISTSDEVFESDRGLL
jgi:anaerobic magnesium-protoporphyrin IX monomethyl ester cyclase